MNWTELFSLICVWINDGANNRETGDLRRHHAHYDVIVMSYDDGSASQDCIVQHDIINANSPRDCLVIQSIYNSNNPRDCVFNHNTYDDNSARD